jgi:hypothetical protein
MAERLTFNRAGTARIVAAVRKSEQKLPPAPRRDKTRVDATPPFWIELTEEGEDADLGWYSWKMVYPDGTLPENWKDSDPAITGILTAREINDRSGLAATLPARYLVTFVGYDGDGYPVYIFSAGNLPTGQYQFMHYQTIAQWQAGWDMPFGHPALVEVAS